MNVVALKIVARTLLLGGVFALAAIAAFMRGGEPGITFALENGINLTIGSRAFYNGLPVSGSTWVLKDLVPGVDKFFNIEDVKPGDSGEATIDMHVESRGPVWMCLDFSNLQSNDNGVNEPESHEDLNGTAEGELALGMEFFAWRDDGDGVFEVGEQPLFGTSTQSASVVLNAATYPIADSTTGSPLPDGTTNSVGIAWCAGDLFFNLTTAEISCEGAALWNSTQTDSFSVDVAIRAETEGNNFAFTCAGGGDSGRGRPLRPERPERPERPTR
ncbi:hypothetical protein HY413_02655 [Candidatus Kaiserbacteria bacterium]|nr:hypothetical protein [Candidatus Kaiserbacteria bacterium]